MENKTFQINVHNSMDTTPSYGDKRLHFDGVIDFICPNCQEAERRAGSDFIYCPDTFTDLTFWCPKCDKEEAVFKILDIRKEKLTLEVLSEQWQVSFKEKRYVEIVKV